MHLLRKLVFVLGVSILLVSQALALGVGGSELHSALNQPLKADIELTNLGDLQEGDIVVSLASNADFERAGIDRLMFYSQLNFELMLNHETGPKIRVTTREPVREPYLNFLLELRWASGRLIREYTFLLDLPTFDEDSGRAAVEAAGRSERTTQPSEPRSSRTAPPASRQEERQQARAGSSASGSSFGPVGSGDTLWEIALQVRPGRDLSVHQTMLALQRKNPEAFINGNINMLREGQILRLPNRQEIQAVSQRDAVNQVAQHNRDWSDNKTGAQLDASGRQTSRRQAGGQPEGQLRLATPAQETANRAGQGGGSNEGQGQALASELAASREELDKTRRENQELAARVEDLESQIETMERLIEASNEQLSALRAASEQNRQSAAGDSGADQAPAESQPQATEDTQQDTSTADQTAASAQEQAEQASDENDKRVVRSVPQNKSWLDLVMDNLLWLAIAALAVLLLVYYGYRRRNQQQAVANDQGPLDSSEFDSEEPLALGPDQNESYDQEPLSEEDYTSEEGYEFEQGDLEDTQDQIEAETGDAVAEADIYIAYGKLDQAEELLLKELKKDPRAPAVLAKLLELYSEKQDIESFDQHYATLLGTDDRAAIQRGSELRDMIPGADPFDISALEQSPSESEDTVSDSDQAIDLEGDAEDLGFDFDDLDSGDGSQEPQVEPAPQVDKAEAAPQSGDQNDDQSFDFDLDEDFDFDLGELDEGAEQGTAPSLDDSGDLTLDQEPSAALNEEPSAVTNEEPSAVTKEEPSSTDDEEPVYELDTEDDDFSFDWEDSDTTPKDSDTGSIEDDFPELDVSLDELPTSEDSAIDMDSDEAEPKQSQNTETDDTDALDDWDLDLEPDEQSLSALDTELSDLDQLDEVPGQTQDEEQGQDQGQGQDEGDDEATSAYETDYDIDFEEELSNQTHEDTVDLDEALEPDPELELSELDEDLSGLDSGPEEEALDTQENEVESLEGGEEELSGESQPEESGADTDLPQDQTTEQSPQQVDTSLEDQDQDQDQDEDEDEDEDSVFEEALSGLDDEDAQVESQDQEQTPGEAADDAAQPEEDKSEEAMDEELDFLADTDEAATKLDLARAYIDMGDADGARDILEEVAQEGDDQQKQEAQELLGRID